MASMIKMVNPPSASTGSNTIEVRQAGFGTPVPKSVRLSKREREERMQTNLSKKLGKKLFKFYGISLSYHYDDDLQGEIFDLRGSENYTQDNLMNALSEHYDLISNEIRDDDLYVFFTLWNEDGTYIIIYDFKIIFNTFSPECKEEIRRYYNDSKLQKDYESSYYTQDVVDSMSQYEYYEYRYGLQKEVSEMNSREYLTHIIEMHRGTNYGRNSSISSSYLDFSVYKAKSKRFGEYKAKIDSCKSIESALSSACPVIVYSDDICCDKDDDNIKISPLVYNQMLFTLCQY